MKGDPAKLDFLAYYMRNGQALAACSIGETYSAEFIAFLDYLGDGQAPSAVELAEIIA